MYLDSLEFRNFETVPWRMLTKNLVTNKRHLMSPSIECHASVKVSSKVTALPPEDSTRPSLIICRANTVPFVFDLHLTRTTVNHCLKLSIHIHLPAADSCSPVVQASQRSAENEITLNSLQTSILQVVIDVQHGTLLVCARTHRFQPPCDYKPPHRFQCLLVELGAQNHLHSDPCPSDTKAASRGWPSNSTLKCPLPRLRIPQNRARHSTL
jgi:hypothetical protein